MFNADEYLAATTPPSIVIGGQTYTGKLLGFDDWLRFQQQFDRIEQKQADLEEIHRLAGDLCQALELPVDHVLALPMGAVVAAMADFLKSHFAEVPRQAPASEQAE